MRILVIDDHILFRESLRYLLMDLEPSTVIIEASSPQEALAAVSECADLNLILLDLHLSGANGLSILPALREKAPGVPVVVLSAEMDAEIVREVLAAGATEFIRKTAGGREITRALRLILSGEGQQTVTP